MIRLYTILNDPIAYKKTTFVYVRKYHPERYNRYNQLQILPEEDLRYKQGFRIPDMDTMEEIALDTRFLDNDLQIFLWLLEITVQNAWSDNLQ